ncbi:PTS mannitol transporter subunit IICB [Clostridium sp.]|uniref:PTS mannitol transporter subunit IICB n=1 Tax=Clostridium sp. TaxID=1506 RepID=UPI002602A26F|nr:PTS mannitol transporter subunit IICB [Clostridium sp.]
MNTKARVQKIGNFLSSMVLPNIAAFIAWGLITALFIPTGWIPNENLANLVGPMLSYLLPILIGFQGGNLIYGTRGAVVGAIATAGVVVGSSIPMFIGAMIMGPLGGWLIKKFDELIEGKVPTGFEMLVNNFSAGILGAGLSMFAFKVIEPLVTAFSNGLGNLAGIVTEKGLLPLIAIAVEPAKILFLNNAINHGILTPLGLEQAKEMGKSIYFLLEANPGPGLGILLAYIVYGRGNAKQSAPGAVIIHFLGGIHEIYFPYILMKPALLLAVIGGGIAANLTFVLTKAGLVAAASPGSIFAILAMTPKGGHFGVIAGVLVGAVVSFAIGSLVLKSSKSQDTDELEDAQNKIKNLKAESKGQAAATATAEVLTRSEALPSKIELIVFACDAGMGSSAMGESILKKKIKEAGINIPVSHCPVSQIPNNADVVFTQENLEGRARASAPNAHIITIKNFLDNGSYDKFIKELKNR